MPDDAPAAPAAPAPAAPAAPAPAPDQPAAPAPSDSFLGGDKPAAPAAPAEPYVNPDGTFIADWTQKLPTEFDDVSRVGLGKYKNVQELAKAYRNVERMVGQKGIVPLTPESTPEQVARYREAMGVPADPIKYAETVKPKVEVPPDVQWNDDIAQQYFEAAHRLNIPPDAMKELVQLNLKQREFEMKANLEAVANRKVEGVNLLRREWGANFDQNKKLAQRAAAYYGGDPEDPGFASLGMVKMWVRAMKDMEEGKFLNSGGSLPAGTGDFAAQAKDIQTNPKNQYYQRYRDGDADVQSMVRNLWKKASGA